MLKVFKALIMFLGLAIIALGVNAAVVTGSKIENTNQVQLIATGSNSKQFSFRLKAVFRSDVLQDVIGNINTVCTVSVVSAELDCADFAWAPIKVLEATTNRSVIVFNPHQLQTDNANFQVESVYVYLRNMIIPIIFNEAWGPEDPGDVPTLGSTCDVPGTSTIQTTVCGTIEDDTVCCDGFCRVSCVGFPPNATVQNVYCDANQGASCTIKDIGGDSGPPPPPDTESSDNL